MHIDDTHKHVVGSSVNIHNNIAGKTIDMALTDGKALVLCATDGHEYRIEWTDGEPVLTAVNVRVAINLPPMYGDVGKF